MTQRWLWQVAAFAWGFAEATLFFVVPDVLLTYIALRLGMRDGLMACLSAALGAGLGGLTIYAWSARHLQAAQNTILSLPSINQDMIDNAWQRMIEKGWLAATFEGPLTATPYKVFAMLAPHIGAERNLFALTSVAARLPRFLIVTFVVAFITPLLRPYISERRLSLGLAGAWIVFYAVYWSTVPW